MVRQHDHHFAKDEVLYRRLAPAELNGSHPFPAAMSLKGGLSVSRSKYCVRAPTDALFPRHAPEHCCVAAARVDALPYGVRVTTEKVSWELIVRDDPRPPENGWPAICSHAEVRLVKEGQTEGKKNPDGMRAQLQIDLAKAFTKCYEARLGPERSSPPPECASWTNRDHGQFLDRTFVPAVDAVCPEGQPDVPAPAPVSG